MMFSFNLNRDEKEAIYSAVTQAAQDGQYIGITREYVDKMLRENHPVELNAFQIKVILKYLLSAIEHYENAGDDWLRAVQYRNAREVILKQHREKIGLVNV